MDACFAVLILCTTFKALSAFFPSWLPANWSIYEKKSQIKYMLNVSEINMDYLLKNVMYDSKNQKK